MGYLLNVAYLLLLVIVSPWLAWQALRHKKYGPGLLCKFLGSVPRRQSPRPCAWLHGVSVGEINLLAPLLHELQQVCPQWEFVISATTRAGYELARRKYADRHTVFYCPLDFTWAVRRAMQRVRPSLLVLAELELWPNLIAAAKQAGARVAVINGRLSDHSFRGYRRIGWLVARSLRQVDLVAAQNPVYAQRFMALGARADRVVTTGSMKFDGKQTRRDNPQTQRLAALAGVGPQDAVFLAGSTQHPEEAIALEVFRGLAPQFPHLRLVLVPRHPERFAAVAGLLADSGLRWQRRSALEKGAADAHWQVLLVDTIGELAAWWGTAQVAFVGGSLGQRGGQNMIEPAAYGAAVCFGPNTHNFRDIVADLLKQQAAVVVHSAEELAAFVQRCLAEPDFARRLGQRAAAFVQRQQGAARRTALLLAEPEADEAAHPAAA